MKRYWYICLEGHKYMEQRDPARRFEPGTCCYPLDYGEIKCGRFSKPIYGRLERVVDMLLSLPKKVGW